MGKLTEKELLDEMITRRDYLCSICEEKRKENSKFGDVSEGKIRVEKSGNGYQYYLRCDGKDTCGNYVRRSENEIIRCTLQKEYNDRVIRAATQEIKVLNRYITKTPPIGINSIYFSMSEGRKQVISPICETDEEFAKAWKSFEYVGKEFGDDAPEFYSQNGERVRSKSEIIIANTLSKYNIPYRYECPLKVSKMGVVYPDFTALNVRKRKEIYIEHLGLLDDATYRENAISKITKYEMDGIVLGDNLLLTYETAASPLNIPLLEKKIRLMLL